MTIRKERWKLRIFEPSTKWVVETNQKTDTGTTKDIAFIDWEHAKIYEKLLEIEKMLKVDHDNKRKYSR